ncbi:MAG: hypothetical protein K5983_01710 [Lactobacillus sp.]|nr:hypothetical protein [Lactobacillus sp.]
MNCELTYWDGTVEDTQADFTTEKVTISQFELYTLYSNDSKKIPPFIKFKNDLGDTLIIPIENINKIKILD